MDKINLILSVWKKQAPTAKFAEMTVDQYETAMKPALDAQQRMIDLEQEMEVGRKDLVNKSAECHGVALRVVDGVKANPAFGNNSPVYKAMGYVAVGDRQSGRTWKTQAPVTPVAENKTETQK